MKSVSDWRSNIDLLLPLFDLSSSSSVNDSLVSPISKITSLLLHFFEFVMEHSKKVLLLTWHFATSDRCLINAVRYFSGRDM